MTSAVPFLASVTFGGFAQTLHGAVDVSVYQKEFMHDIAVFTMWADDVDADSYYSGMPMQLVFGRPGASRTFYGYVNHPQRSNVKKAGATKLEANSVTLTCVGASFWMKQTDTKSWSNYTASQVVQAIATQFGLDSNVVDHSTVWPSLQMHGRSYWEFCVDLAQRIGYTFYCNGIQLVFKPRNTDPMNLVGFVRAFDYKNDSPAIPEFKPMLGAANPSGGTLANRQMATIDVNTGTVAIGVIQGNPSPSLLGTVTEAPVFNFTDQRTVGSAQELYAKLNGVALSNQLYITAEAKVMGDSRLSQGALVYIANANGAQNGLWFVTSACHHISLNTYEIDLCLGRDSRGAVTIYNFPTNTNMVPLAMVQSNKWIAA